MKILHRTCFGPLYVLVLSSLFLMGTSFAFSSERSDTDLYEIQKPELQQKTQQTEAQNETSQSEPQKETQQPEPKPKEPASVEDTHKKDKDDEGQQFKTICIAAVSSLVTGLLLYYVPKGFQAYKYNRRAILTYQFNDTVPILSLRVREKIISHFS